MPKGYDYDACATGALMTMSVKDGRIVLPSSMSYRVLALWSGKTMSPAVLRKIGELVAAGATVVGPKPECSPGLTDYPARDAEVKKLADELWTKGVSVKSPTGALASLKVKPDFVCTTKGSNVAYIHRVADGADIYFVSNQKPAASEVECTFRVSGKTPELWHSDSGVIENAPIYAEKDGQTTVPLRFAPAGSVFVVFRHASVADHAVAVHRTGGNANEPKMPVEPLIIPMPAYELATTSDGVLEVQVWKSGKFEVVTAAGKTLKATVADVPKPVEITGPWELNFPPNRGAPAKITLDKLISWTEHANPGVKYFSGTAVYRNKFARNAAKQAGERYLLDLGDMKNIAEAELNGKSLGILWKPPYRVDVTDTLQQGENELVVKITNLWPNRLIGDEQLPEDCEWNGSRLKAWPQWVLDGKPSPTGRFTFTTWHHWTKDDQPLPSGLFGPVLIRTGKTIALPDGERLPPIPFDSLRPECYIKNKLRLGRSPSLLTEQGACPVQGEPEQSDLNCCGAESIALRGERVGI